MDRPYVLFIYIQLLKLINEGVFPLKSVVIRSSV